jgi:predicted adenine nucleotide alpha hydrolase (AANH) superfamily ATPase
MKKKNDDQELYEKIKKALENYKYRFRTLAGVASEIGLKQETVEATISQNKDKIVVLARKVKNGQRLVTTRKYYKKKASVKEKLMGAVLNRVY